MNFFNKILLISLLLTANFAFSQQVIFCESVTAEGNPVNQAKEFSIGDKGGFFKVLVKPGKQIEARNVVFDVYLMKEDKETFNSSIKMDVAPGLTWFYKEVTFFQPGEYHVYVYDDRDQVLGVGQVDIKMK
jgi:hypothetical protein